MHDYEIRAAAPEDFDEIARLRIEAFTPDDGSRRWFRERNDTVDTLVIEAGERLVGCAKYLPVGQYFGGGRVPMGAAASVIVETAWRGRGVGPQLMRDLIRVMRGDGLALSMLYASTMRLYRSVGYEVAGEGTNTVVPVAAFRAIDRGAPEHLRTGTPDDVAAIRACYERVAPGRNGWLDRSDVWWDRYRGDPLPDAHHLLYEVDGRVEGYLHRRQSPSGPYDADFALVELVADDPLVTQTLWASLGAHTMQTSTITIENVPVDELLVVLREQWHEVRPAISDRTLSRILDLPAAIAARGFPTSVDIAVTLEVLDDVVADNDGDFRLEVSNGSGAVTPASDLTEVVTLDIGALTAIYTGWTSATTLARHGRITGPPDALSALDTAFAGPTPFSVDDF